MRCEIPDDPLMVGVALATRRVIADLGTVPNETIHPADSFAHDLVQLPFRDSLDWLSLILGIEQQFDGKVFFPNGSVIDEAFKLAGGRRSDLQVKHVVKAIALAASYRPKKLPLDEDW